MNMVLSRFLTDVTESWEEFSSVTTKGFTKGVPAQDGRLRLRPLLHLLLFISYQIHSSPSAKVQLHGDSCVLSAA
jgi:hypothetical protein